MHLTTHTARRRHNMLSVAASAARTTRGIEPFNKTAAVSKNTGRKNRSSSKVVRCLKGTGTVIVRRVFRLRNGLPFYPLSLSRRHHHLRGNLMCRIGHSPKSLLPLFSTPKKKKTKKTKTTNAKPVSGDRAVGTENIRSGAFEGEHDPKSSDRRDHIV